ncbi:MAG: biopolymer transporter ExbD [Candidatus Aminicenantes bacterium]|nr:biopolymer transporter ExbD [Candidatus Aminicenantes bacterium]
MKFKTGTKRRGRALINITSLIDVLFLLLIFFMVSSTFLEQPGIQLDLPQAESAVLVEEKKFTLFINKEGKLFLNDKEIALKDLEVRIREVLPEMKDGTLILKADKDISYGLVVEVMDGVKKSGVKRLVIGTRLKQR